MFHVPFYRLYEVGDQVMAPSELDIDLGEPVSNAIAFVDETVVNTDRPENYCSYNDEKYQE